LMSTESSTNPWYIVMSSLLSLMAKTTSSKLENPYGKY